MKYYMILSIRDSEIHSRNFTVDREGPLCPISSIDCRLKAMNVGLCWRFLKVFYRELREDSPDICFLIKWINAAIQPKETREIIWFMSFL